MAELIDLEELRPISQTLRRMQADLSPLYSRFDGVERRLAIVEERQAEMEASIRLLGENPEPVDCKLDTMTARVRDDVARLEARMDTRFGAMDRNFDAVLAALADLKASRNP